MYTYFPRVEKTTRFSYVHLIYLHNFQYQCGVLKVIFNRKMNLSNILTWLRVVNVHVYHRDATILQFKIIIAIKKYIYSLVFLYLQLDCLSHVYLMYLTVSPHHLLRRLIHKVYEFVDWPLFNEEMKFFKNNNHCFLRFYL